MQEERRPVIVEKAPPKKDYSRLKKELGVDKYGQQFEGPPTLDSLATKAKVYKELVVNLRALKKFWLENKF